MNTQEYREKLKALREKLMFALQGRIDTSSLLKEAEKLLQYRNKFPEVYHQFSDIETMIGDILAIKERNKFKFPGA